MSGRVVVAGSFMMDLVVSAPRRPETGETLVGTGFEVFLGGKGCNQAIAAARSGAATAMIGRLGDDDFGRRFLDRLEAEGIDASGVTVDPDVGTGVATPLVEADGRNSIVIVPRANFAVTPADIEAASSTIAAADVLLVQLELPLDCVVAAAAAARRAGTLVVLNPAPAPDPDVLDMFRGLVDVVIPNEVEAASLTGIDDPRRAARHLHGVLGCSVVVTVGEAGVLVLDDDVPVALPAHAVEVVDTVGAGDAFCGALGTRLAAGESLLDAAGYGNAAAALAVTRRGAEPAMPTNGEIETYLAGRPARRPVLSAAPSRTARPAAR